MGQREQQIIVFNSRRLEKQHRKTISIKSSVTIEQLRQIVKQTLQIQAQNFRLYFHTYNLIYLQLDSYYFEYFRNNLEINKLIKVMQQQPLETILPIVFNRQVDKQQRETTQDQRENKIKIEVQSLIALHPYELQKDSICSFFADDICQMVTFLQTLDLYPAGDKSPEKTSKQIIS